MSYFAEVKCPKCGKKKSIHLGGYGFFGYGKEHCNYCGCGFDPQENCKSMDVDRDCLYNPKTESRKRDYEAEIDLLKKEIENLKEQIKGRSDEYD